MTTGRPSLADALAEACARRIDRGPNSIAVLDWPDGFVLWVALHTLPPRIQWRTREPAGPEDRAWMIVSLAPGSGNVRFEPATAAEVQGLPSAEGFDSMGKPIA